MKKFICTVCGYVHEGAEAPAACPTCKAPAAKFKEQSGTGLVFADEHVIGVAKGVDPEIIEGLRQNFMGECTEVGMYLAMSRAADREGYPEIAEAYKRYAFEEAELCGAFGRSCRRFDEEEPRNARGGGARRDAGQEGSRRDGEAAKPRRHPRYSTRDVQRRSPPR